MNHLLLYQQIYQVRQLAPISINKNYVRTYPLTFDATTLTYHSFFPERTGNNSLNSTFINNDNLIGTKKSYTTRYTNPITFCKRRNCCNNNNNRSTTKHFTYSTQFYNSKIKSPTLQQTIIQSTVKPSVDKNIRKWIIQRSDQ